MAEVHGGSIALLLTDVVMPRMNGRALAETLALRQPGLRVLFMSGYPDDDVMRRTGLAAGERFLAKPFQPTALVERVCAAMIAPPFVPMPDSDSGMRAAG